MKNKIYTTTISNMILAMLLAIITLFPITSFSQSDVPEEASKLVGSKLEDAQKELESKGWEIAFSSLFGKKEYWWNESQKVCINMSFKNGHDHPIKEVTRIPNEECQKGVEAARKVWEKYHDGQSPDESPAINKEREKLLKQGYKVSYWIRDIAPGRSSEYWFNESTQKCMLIAWNTAGKDGVDTIKCEAKYGKNPAPTNNN